MMLPYLQRAVTVSRIGGMLLWTGIPACKFSTAVKSVLD